MKFHTIITILALCLILSGFAFSQDLSPRRVEFTENWGQPGVNVVSQSASGLEIVYSMPFVTLTPIEANNESYTHVALPGVFLPREEGAPNLPNVSRYIAIPKGASVSVEVLASRPHVFENINVIPAPPIPREDDDSPPVYEKNPHIYNRDAYYPDHQVVQSDPMSLRGVDVVILGITPFAYNPVQRELIVYSDLRVRVDFDGGSGQFGDDGLRSRWFEPLLRQNLLNYPSLSKKGFGGKLNGGSEECEYMIFVPDNMAFALWADVIRDFRIKQGISTNIFNIDDLGGTAAAIEAKIDDAYNNWTVKPVAALMLGDVPDMPVHTWTDPSTTCLSDNIYADVDGDDLPDINVARITARNAGELSTTINKFIDYETNPPTSSHFYNRPVIAGGWQESRWFILCAEVVYGFLTNEEGKNPKREYALEDPDPPGDVWSTNQNTSIVVDYFGPGGLGYIPQTPSHLTDWGGNAARINSDVNNGAFWMLHRDHGSPNGWGTPEYLISDLSGLHNDDLVFVLSINCRSGEYDYSPECFTEAFHRMDQGALGLIAASKSSYSFVNDTFVWGMHDAMWSNFDPNYGGGGDDFMPNPGFAHVSGKWYLEQSSWPYNPGFKDNTYHLFHMHGDAFCQVYSEMPQHLTVSHEDEIDINATSFEVTANKDSFIALTANGEILGTADGTGHPVSIAVEPPLNPGIMYVTVTKPNFYRYEAEVVITDVYNAPPSDPYVEGPSEAYLGMLYNFDVESTDIEGDDVFYRFEWGEGGWVPTDWYGPYPEDTTQSFAHAWGLNRPTGQNYEIHVQAMDDRNHNGQPDEGWEAQSDWTGYTFMMANRPPDKPAFDGETHQGYRNVEYTFTATGTDPDGHQLFYKFHWGNGESTTWLGPYDSGETVQRSYTYEEPGEFWPAVIVKDDHDCDGSPQGGEPVMSDKWYMVIVNLAPAKPTISAPVTSGHYSHVFDFYTATTDPEDDNVWFQWDWDEPHIPGQLMAVIWMGPYCTNPVQFCHATHQWQPFGPYFVRVRAKDEYGAMSEWSDPVEINIGI